MATHYEVLGVPETASADEIKRRYRELARRWHPDVARTPDAAERFKTINEAYRVLSNPTSRAQYDAELKLQAARRAETRRSATDPTASRTTERPRARPSATGRPRDAAGARRPDSAETSTLISRLLRDAELAMQRLRLYEAERLCRAVLQLDRRNATAHEILGDICSIRGRTDAALSHYTIAVQLDPRNTRLKIKFERTAAAQSRFAQGASSHIRRAAAPAAQAMALMFGLGAIFVLIFIVAEHSPGSGQASWVPWDWTPGVFLGLPTAGAIAGWACSYAGLLRPARGELLVTTSSRSGRSVVPMGVILVILSLACFWLAAVLYAALAATQEALSRSILIAFALSASLVGIFACMAPHAWGPILGFGGNMVFPAMVAGWALADRTHE